MKKILVSCLVAIIAAVVGNYYLEVVHVAPRAKAAQLLAAEENAKGRALTIEENAKDRAVIIEENAKDRALTVEEGGKNRGAFVEESAKDRALTIEENAKDRALIIEENSKERTFKKDENEKNRNAQSRQEEHARAERKKQRQLKARREHVKELRKAINIFVYEMQGLDTYNVAVAKSHTSTRARWAFMLSHNPKALEKMHPVLMSSFNAIKLLIDANNGAEVDLYNYIDSVRVDAFKDTVALADSKRRTEYKPHMSGQFMTRINEGLSSIERGE
ncbi:hypothetical protein [Halodesulfovibrio sp.]|jgi:hypothetical protein|uniref:hypothetical protein n=1 Tax=Halodesulfovibrio sp. TaxID=1912772 RepID=UPI0025F668DD|nr:hypothetical protein [Halodesulfovibrio sp.]MCT4627960.1 hypothetical protein [Halodesulfovibrio sp.]